MKSIVGLDYILYVPFWNVKKVRQAIETNNALKSQRIHTIFGTEESHWVFTKFTVTTIGEAGSVRQALERLLSDAKRFAL